MTAAETGSGAERVPSSGSPARDRRSGGFRCVRCHTDAELVLEASEARCSRCGAAFPLLDGAVPVLLSDALADANAYGSMFGSDAEHYDQRFHVDPEHGRWVLRRMREIRPELWDRQGGSVLEIGAGSGHLTRALEAGELWRFDELTVTDLSGEMLVANHRQSSAPSGVRFWVCNVRELPFADESLDAVFGFDILHHVLDYGAALRELARVVKPGGFVAVKEPHRGAYRLFSFLCRTVLRLHRRSRSAKLLSAEEEGKLESWTSHLAHLMACGDAGDHETLSAFDDKYFFEPALLERDARAAGFTGFAELNVLYRPETFTPNTPMILDTFRGLGLGPVALTVVAEVAEDLDETMGAQVLREFPTNTVFVFLRS